MACPIPEIESSKLGSGSQDKSHVGSSADVAFPFGANRKGGRKEYREWTRQQKRAFHRSMSCLALWAGVKAQVRWVMLSSVNLKTGEKDLASLSPHFQRLRQMIERRFGYVGIEYLKVNTAEGGGVIHCYLAYRGRKSFYIPQRWLSKAWRQIHGASYVWIKKVGLRRDSRKRLSSYIVSQYLAGQDAFIRMSYSSKRTFGFPLVAVWNEFKNWAGAKGAVRLWHVLMGGGVVAGRAGTLWSLETIKDGWLAYRRVRDGDFTGTAETDGAAGGAAAVARAVSGSWVQLALCGVVA